MHATTGRSYYRACMHRTPSAMVRGFMAIKHHTSTHAGYCKGYRLCMVAQKKSGTVNRLYFAVT